MKYHFSLSLIRILYFVLFILITLPCSVFAQERLSITSNIANLRSGPGTNYEVLWQVEQYHPVLVIKKKGNWFQIKDFEGHSAWLHNSLVGKIRAIITIKKECNVRTGPSTKNAIAFKVERGVPFKVLEKKGNWFKIEHADGDVGWIHSSLTW